MGQNRIHHERGQSLVRNNSLAEHLPLDEGCVGVVPYVSYYKCIPLLRDKYKALQEMKRVFKQNGTLIITEWGTDYWVVKLYHFQETIRWKWRFEHRYSYPLRSSMLTGHVRSVSLSSTDANCEGSVKI